MRAHGTAFDEVLCLKVCVAIHSWLEFLLSARHLCADRALHNKKLFHSVGKFSVLLPPPLLCISQGVHAYYMIKSLGTECPFFLCNIFHYAREPCVRCIVFIINWTVDFLFPSRSLCVERCGIFSPFIYLFTPFGCDSCSQRAFPMDLNKRKVSSPRKPHYNKWSKRETRLKKLIMCRTDMVLKIFCSTNFTLNWRNRGSCDLFHELLDRWRKY